MKNALTISTAASTDNPTVWRLKRFGPIWEVAGLWLVSLIIGVLVVQTLLMSDRHATEDAWRQQRRLFTLANLGARVEADMALGIDPVASGAGLRAVENTFRQDATLYGVVLADPYGEILADSDRADLGGVLPETARLAMQRAKGRTWKVRLGDEVMLGMPVKNAFGEAVFDAVLIFPGERTGLGWPFNLSSRTALDSNTGVLPGDFIAFAVLTFVVAAMAWTSALLFLRAAALSVTAKAGQDRYQAALSLGKLRLARLEQCVRRLGGRQGS